MDTEQNVVVIEEDNEIIDDIYLKFTDNSEIGDGACSCVCISDEQCCGCVFQ